MHVCVPVVAPGLGTSDTKHAARGSFLPSAPCECIIDDINTDCTQSIHSNLFVCVCSSFTSLQFVYFPLDGNNVQVTKKT